MDALPLCLTAPRTLIALKVLCDVPSADLSDDDNESDAAWEYWDLKCGLHNCLYWLYGITLLGRDDEPWVESFEVGGLIAGWVGF